MMRYEARFFAFAVVIFITSSLLKGMMITCPLAMDKVNTQFHDLAAITMYNIVLYSSSLCLFDCLSQKVPQR